MIINKNKIKTFLSMLIYLGKGIKIQGLDFYDFLLFNF